VSLGNVAGHQLPIFGLGKHLSAAADERTVTYGVQGIFFDRDDIRFHGRDERLRVQSFYEGQAFLYEVVKTLSKSAAVAKSDVH